MSGTRDVGEAPASAELDAAERMTVEELRELNRLRRTPRHAYANVPFYRKKFDAAGVSPEDCRSLEDLAAFPVTTKDDLRENYPTGMFAVPPAEIRRIHASSGTTGQPTVVGYTQGDLGTWSDLMARSIRAAGGRVTWPTATACSPAAWAPTTGPSGWAARWSPPPAG